MKKLKSYQLTKLPIAELVIYLDSLTPKIYQEFNNFHLHFVQGGYRPDTGDTARQNQKPLDHEKSKYSRLNISQTRREFYATIDEVIARVTGKDFFVFRQQLRMFSFSGKNRRHASDRKRWGRARRFEKLVTPVREELYRLGYNWADLCG